jgi:hypothetical protein
MITKLTVMAMKDIVRDFGDFLLAAVGSLPQSQAPILASVAQQGPSTVKPHVNADLSTPTPIPQIGMIAPVAELSLAIQIAIICSCVVSFLLLSPMISRMFQPQADLALRMAYALRCSVFSSTPLPLILVTGNDLGGDTGLYSRLTLFFVLNLITLGTFVEIGNHMNVLFLFSLYFLVGSVTLIVVEATKGLKGFSNPGVLMCATSVALLLLYNLGLSLWGQA